MQISCKLRLAHWQNFGKKTSLPFLLLQSEKVTKQTPYTLTVLVSLPLCTVTDQAWCQDYCKRLQRVARPATGGVKSKGKPRMSPPARLFLLMKPRKHLISVWWEGVHYDQKSTVQVSFPFSPFKISRRPC